MTKTEIAKDMKAFCGGSFITTTAFCRYMGLKSREKAKSKYLEGLERVGGAGYFVNDVAERIMERRSL